MSPLHLKTHTIRRRTGVMIDAAFHSVFVGPYDSGRYGHGFRGFSDEHREVVLVRPRPQAMKMTECACLVHLVSLDPWTGMCKDDRASCDAIPRTLLDSEE